MKKGIFTCAMLIVLALGMNSCKKCYKCTQTVTESINGVTDSTLVLTNEQCSGKNGAGPVQNLNSAVADMEANGYICTAQ
jgi:hypothetical protein